MKKFILIVFIPLLFLFTTCALEIANVIGPGGGWVFYDKGNYDGGWRYIMCAPHDFGQLQNDPNLVGKALGLCDENSGGWYKYDWELPDDNHLRKMLECFSYGLTQFSSDPHYLSIPNKCHPYPEQCDEDCDPAADWGKVIYHKNFDSKANGEPEIVGDYTGLVRIRAIRRF
ncbi:MAG: hypothetical protein LBU88_06080 [Treponema sp.]|jgi:hypothetical protein|nr:hypothetical protein [Treponema sp.]